MSNIEAFSNPKPPAYLLPPKDHSGDDFRNWCVNIKKLGYSDQYIAAISGESIKTIRRYCGKRKKNR